MKLLAQRLPHRPGCAEAAGSVAGIALLAWARDCAKLILSRSHGAGEFPQSNPRGANPGIAVSCCASLPAV